MASKKQTSPSQGGLFLVSTPRVLVGVTGGIAAYKAAILVRRLKEWGADVTVAPTPASLEMVGKVTWEALSGNPVYVHVSENTHEVAHVRTGQEADLIVIAPATANTLAKIRAGFADNMLTASVLVATCPIIVAPAMHTEMWKNAATQSNVEALRERGIEFAGPVEGRLTGKDSGAGRMMEPEDIAHLAIERLKTMGFSGKNDAGAAVPGEPQSSVPVGESLAGQFVVVSAGGTHEPIDPVRFISNRSSGRMGVEIAKAAYQRGATAVVVGANLGAVADELPEGITLIPIETALDLHKQMDLWAQKADVIVMAAAVSDFRVDSASDTKMKRDGNLTLELVENPDILQDLAHNRRREGQLIVGFAAETGDEQYSYLDYGRQKAARKGADLIAVNEVGVAKGFGEVDTRITLIDANGQIYGDFAGAKPQVASELVAAIVEQLAHKR